MLDATATTADTVDAAIDLSRPLTAGRGCRGSRPFDGYEPSCSPTNAAAWSRLPLTKYAKWP